MKGNKKAKRSIQKMSTRKTGFKRGRVSIIRLLSKDILGKTLPCPDCDKQLRLRFNEEYKRYYYVCEDVRCKGMHACHPNGEPCGIPAPLEVRRYRKKIHILANKIWNWNSALEVKRMYKWMEKNAGKRHISEMFLEDLILVERLLRIEFMKRGISES